MSIHVFNLLNMSKLLNKKRVVFTRENITVKIVYYTDLKRNPNQIDPTWMLTDYSQYMFMANDHTRFDALIHILINQ